MRINDEIQVTLQVGERANHDQHGGDEETGSGQAIVADAQCQLGRDGDVLERN